MFYKAEFTDTYTDDFRLSGDGIAKSMGIYGIDISKCGVGERYKFKADKPIGKLYASADDSPYSKVYMNCWRKNSY